MTGFRKMTAKQSPRDPDPGSPRPELIQRQDFPIPINKIRPEKGPWDLFSGAGGATQYNSPGQAFPNSGGDQENCGHCHDDADTLPEVDGLAEKKVGHRNNQDRI